MSLTHPNTSTLAPEDHCGPVPGDWHGRVEGRQQRNVVGGWTALVPSSDADKCVAYEPRRFDPALHIDGQGLPLTANAITVFNTPQRSVKSFKRSESGTVQGVPYKPGFKGKPRVYYVDGLAELFLLLTWAERERRTFVMRGMPITEKKRIVRRYKTEPETFTDAPRSWLCIDIDGLPIPPGLSYECPDELAEYVISKLPQQHFAGASYIWQLSSSAGIKEPNKIKLHLWFWLDTPLDCTHLRPWAKSLKGLIDPALYNPVQPHITARPSFVGDLQDPFPVRTGIVLKRDDAVRDADQLRAPEVKKKSPQKLRKKRAKATWAPPEADRTNAVSDASPFRNWGVILDEIDREQHFHSPIYRLILSYFASGGVSIEALKTQLRTEVPPRNRSDRADVNERYLIDTYLDEEIQNALRFLKSNKGQETRRQDTTVSSQPSSQGTTT